MRPARGQALTVQEPADAGHGKRVASHGNIESPKLAVVVDDGGPLWVLVVPVNSSPIPASPTVTPVGAPLSIARSVR